MHGGLRCCFRQCQLRQVNVCGRENASDLQSATIVILIVGALAIAAFVYNGHANRHLSPLLVKRVLQASLM